jgi:hypothetical protein
MTFVFLDYLSRSGSTLLAKKLNEFEGVYLGLEAHAVLYNYVRVGPILDSEGLSQYLSMLASDNKFSFWEVDLGLLQNELDVDYPIKLLTIIEKIVHQKSKEIPEVVVMKGFDYFLFESVLGMQSSCKCLFIVRDFRAIYGSMRSSIDSQTKKAFVPNVYKFLLKYDFQLTQLSLIERDLLIIRYEDFIQNSNKTIEYVLDFIGLHGYRKSASEDYYDRIPLTQKHLHTLTKGEGIIDKTRNQSWESTLSNFEVRLIEVHLNKYFLKHGYHAERKGSILSEVLVYCISFILRFTKVLTLNARRNTRGEFL